MEGHVHENLQKLRQLTEALPKFPIGSPLNMEGKYSMSYPVKDGECMGGRLFQVDGTVSVTKWYNTKGANFRSHAHAARELIFVYDGIMDITIEGEQRFVKAGEFIVAEPYQKHEATAVEDTYCITITYPPAEGFP